MVYGIPSILSMGFTSGTVVKNPPAMSEMRVRSLGQEDPLMKEMATHSSLPGESHGQRSLAGYSPCGHKASDTTEQLSTGSAVQLYIIQVSNKYDVTKTHLVLTPFTIINVHIYFCTLFRNPDP